MMISLLGGDGISELKKSLEEISYLLPKDEVAKIDSIIDALEKGLRKEDRVQRKRVKDLETRLKTLERDDVTDLISRKVFNEELERICEEGRRENKSLTISYFDLDGFKRVNDTYGHEVGDQVLRYVAGLLRRSDLVTREREKTYGTRKGGDEFVMVTSGLSPTLVGKMADTLLERINTPILIGPDKSRKIRIEASLGIVHIEGSQFLDQSVRPGDIVDLADQAMFNAKKGGKNAWICYFLHCDSILRSLINSQSYVCLSDKLAGALSNLLRYKS